MNKELEQQTKQWLLGRGMWLEQLSSRINVGGESQSPTLLELFTEHAAHLEAQSKPIQGEVGDRSSVTAQVELSESQWAVLSNRMIEEHRKYGNHLRGGHWAEIAARKVVSHMRDFGCLAAPSTVPLSPEMVELLQEAKAIHLRDHPDEETDPSAYMVNLDAMIDRLLGIR